MSVAPLRHLRRLAAALAFCLAVAASPRHAAAGAAPLTLSLRYGVDERLEGCPSDAEFRRSLIEQLRYDPFRDDGEHHVVTELHESEAGLEGSVVWSDAAGHKEGERHFASPSRDCAELAKAMSFSIAVQIQLLNGLAAADASSKTEAPPAPPTPLPRAAPRLPPPTPAERAPLPPRFLSVGLGPTVDFGTAPAAQAGARVSFGARAGAWSLELAALGALPVKRTLPDGSGFRATFFGFSLAPCAHGGSFALCAIGRLGRLGADGFGVDDSRSPASFTAHAGLRLGFQQPLSGRLLLGAHADGLALLTPHAVYLNAVPVWTEPKLALSLGIDIGLIFK